MGRVPDYVHPATLACVYGGLKALGELEQRSPLLDKASMVKDFILSHCVNEGRFVKSVHCLDEIWKPALTGVDASLLWLAVPFGVCEVDDPIMRKTVQTIESELKHEGIQRYIEDRYYGGGEWLLLTAWYGWYQRELGNHEEAHRCLEWIISKADHFGRLPEQVPDQLRESSAYSEWLGKWGTCAAAALVSCHVLGAI